MLTQPKNLTHQLIVCISRSQSKAERSQEGEASEGKSQHFFVGHKERGQDPIRFAILLRRSVNYKGPMGHLVREEERGRSTRLTFWIDRRSVPGVALKARIRKLEFDLESAETYGR
jgi:hypothetical protein